MKQPETLTFDELAARYCDRQESTPAELRATLQEQRTRFDPDGFCLLECHQLDSSYVGQYALVAYGPRNTWKQPPARGKPVSPRGLASDMSVCVAIMLASGLDVASDG